MPCVNASVSYSLKPANQNPPNNTFSHLIHRQIFNSRSPTPFRFASLSLSTFQRPPRRRSAPMTNRWIRPEVYPLFAATGVAVGICAMQLIRNITTNPEVRVSKENRAAGVLDNHSEGERYSQHFVRKYVRGRAPEIMPGINSFFTDPERN